jgi:hypothetical protein
MWRWSTARNFFAGGVAGGVAVVSFAAYYNLTNPLSSRFDAVFSSKSLPDRDCIGRQQFRNQLLKCINGPGSDGIISVSGRLQTGKSTAIAKALEGRKNVIYICWKEDNIPKTLTVELLNESLKDNFNLKIFGDDIFKFLNNLSFGPFGNVLFNVVPLPRPDTSEKNIESLNKTLKDIETILKFARDNKLPRPVIYIDEIGALEPLLKNEDSKKHISVGW